MVEERASKRQLELLSFVDGFIKEHGYGPSYREIMTAIGYKSVSTVAIHIEGLIAKGYLARRDKSARSLEVITTRSDTVVASPSPTVITESQIAAELELRIKKADLTKDQERSIIESLTLLGLTDLSETNKEADEAAV